MAKDWAAAVGTPPTPPPTSPEEMATVQSTLRVERLGEYEELKMYIWKADLEITFPHIYNNTEYSFSV